MELIVVDFSRINLLGSFNNFFSAIVNDKEFNSSYNAIADFRGNSKNFSYDEVLELVDMVIKNDKIHGKRKTAFLTDSPNSVFVTTIYELNLKDFPMKIKTFSTIQNAINWLDLSDNMEEINDTLVKLKTQLS